MLPLSGHGWGRVETFCVPKYHRSRFDASSSPRFLAFQLTCDFFGLSGTIKKIQLRQVTYNRLLVATIIAALKLPSSKDEKPLSLPAPSIPADDGSSKVEGEEEAKWKRWEEKERVVVEELLD